MIRVAGGVGRVVLQKKMVVILYAGHLEDAKVTVKGVGAGRGRIRVSHRHSKEASHRSCEGLLSLP